MCFPCKSRGGGGVLPYMSYIGMCRCEGYGFQAVYSSIGYINPGPVVRKPINANPRLKINQGVYFSTPKCSSKLMFGKTLH